jgi:hypothetical protein
MKLSRGTFLVLFSIFVSLLGCRGSEHITKVTVREVLERPREYENRLIQIDGEVTGIFSLVIVKFFTVKDKTGEIVVLTERILPKKGDRILLKGRVIEPFSIGDQTLTAIKEEKG